MSDNYGDLLGAFNGPDPLSPPFHRLIHYPKFLVFNIYGGYTLTSGKIIGLTNPDQMLIAQRLQAALEQIGIRWEIRQHLPHQGRENVGVQFEIKSLKQGNKAYELEMEIYYPEEKEYQTSIISLIAHDLRGLENGVATLIQVIQLAFAEFGKNIASLWIRDWPDNSDSQT
jgi:signal transduction histidine kinase